MKRTVGFCGPTSVQDGVVSAGPTVVRLSGEHDMFTVDALTDAIAQATAVGDGDLVVDLGDVEFMSVATVRVLLHAQLVLQRQARTIVLRSPPACAQRVLDLCGVADLFELSAAADEGP